MSMQIVTLIQGTPEWHAHRAQHFNASDAPAMMGISPYKSRTELVKERATGVTPEVTPAQQHIFDRGHAIEALARPLAEEILNDDLSPCVGTEGPYSASFDGITFMHDVAWECKTLNASLREALPYSGEIHDISHGARLPEHYRVQMEQQAMVSGCERILFTAASLGDDGQLDDVRHCWYTPDPAMRQRLVTGWAQFEQDVAAYNPAAERPAPAVAAPMESLPAVVVQVSGALTVGGNLDAFGAALRAFIERIPKKPSTDQEFADAEAACKALKKVEDALIAAKDGALSQVAPVEVMCRTVGDLHNLARTTRLALDKLVSAEKDRLRTALVTGAQAQLDQHIQALNQRLGANWLPRVAGGFGEVIKGKKSLANMEDAVAVALTNAKHDMNVLAERLEANRKHLVQDGTDWIALFADFATVGAKAEEDFQALAALRINQHKQAEAARLEAERERIRLEEERKAQAAAERAAQAERERIRAEEAAKLQAQAAIEAAAKTEAPSAQPEPVAEVKATETVTQQAQAAPANEAANGGDTLTLGQINTLLAPLKIDAAGLEQLGFHPSKTVKAAKHYPASSIPAMVQAMVTHLQGVLATA